MTDPNSPRARLVGINHVALEVDDLDAALGFYREVFEFDLRGRSDSAAFLDMGDQFLALAEADDSTGERSDDARHFGVVVDDLDAVVRRLEELGVDRPPTSAVEFCDPWGNRVQVVSYEEVQFTKTEEVLDGMELSGLEKSDSALEELSEKGMAPEAESDDG